MNIKSELKFYKLRTLILSIIVGIVLGAVSEFALIFNMKFVINITQSFTFWAIIMFIISILSKEYITSILSSSLSMTFMNSTYYLIRLIKSGYTNTGNWKRYIIMGIAGSIYISILVYCIKQKILRKKITDNVPKISLILMTIFSILFLAIDNYLIFFKNTLLFGYYAYDPAINGVYLGSIIGLIFGIYFNNKRKQRLV